MSCPVRARRRVQASLRHIAPEQAQGQLPPPAAEQATSLVPQGTDGQAEKDFFSTYRRHPDQDGVRTRIAASDRLILGGALALRVNPFIKHAANFPKWVNPFAPEGYQVTDHLFSPMQEKSLAEVFTELDSSRLQGTTHTLLEQWVRRAAKLRRADGYAEGNGVLSANLVSPLLLFNVKTKNLYRTEHVYITDPDDCERIANRHVRKSPIYQTFGFMHSVISTDDNEYWKTQRQHLAPAFLPHSSLAHVFPITAKRARSCAARLWDESAQGKRCVDMSNFFLHETQAQLQLALMGMDEDFMNKTNAPLRAAFAGRHPDPMYVRNFLVELAAKMEKGEFTAPGLGVSGCPVKGPLSAALTSLNDDYATLFANCFIFSFAGHDTTGHTLAFLLYELCRNPDVQRRLQAEVDELWQMIGEGELLFSHLTSLKYMTRCVMETLRLWPAVPNGTFRRLDSDELVNGPKGKRVLVPKGTLVTIDNWCRHRNPALWGEDVLSFNPDREFADKEIWYNKGLSAQNPSTKRFSPFTFGPRDCIGKNFAHMEIRAILANLIRDFHFTLVPPKRVFGGVNRGGTMGPADVWSEESLLADSDLPHVKVAMMAQLQRRH